MHIVVARIPTCRASSYREVSAAAGTHRVEPRNCRCCILDTMYYGRYEINGKHNEVDPCCCESTQKRIEK